VFSLKERDDCEQNVQQFLDQLRVALIEFALFEAIDELVDLGRISGGDVVIVFHRRRSRRAYARQKRTPRPERKYFLFHEGSLHRHGIITDLMNIGVADDQAKQRFGLYEHGGDFGGKTHQKAFVNQAGSVHGERDTPCSNGSRGALERRIDALVP
jgi:hypothetical protein